MLAGVPRRRPCSNLAECSHPLGRSRSFVDNPSVDQRRKGIFILGSFALLSLGGALVGFFATTGKVPFLHFLMGPLLGAAAFLAALQFLMAIVRITLMGVRPGPLKVPPPGDWRQQARASEQRQIKTVEWMRRWAWLWALGLSVPVPAVLAAGDKDPAVLIAIVPLFLTVFFIWRALPKFQLNLYQRGAELRNSRPHDDAGDREKPIATWSKEQKGVTLWSKTFKGPRRGD